MNTINKLVVICALLGAVSLSFAYTVLKDEPVQTTVKWNVVDSKGKRMCFAKEIDLGAGEPYVVWYDQTANDGKKESTRCLIDDMAIAMDKSGQRVVYMDISEKGRYNRNR